MEVCNQLHILATLPLGKIPQYPLDRLGGPQEQSGCCGVENILLPVLGIEWWSSSLQPVAVH
jgi:hypothetical protein